jgi:hypothetical protein
MPSFQITIMKRDYIQNPRTSVAYEGVPVLTAQEVVDAMNVANNAIKDLSDTTMKFDINIFETLGMRNLSGMVGEYFARSVVKVSGCKLEYNPHQDGYPDLLLVDTNQKKAFLDTLYTLKDNKRYPIDKNHFSPFKYGGIEVKSTCGNTPPAKKVPKPLIGEQRVGLVNSFDWKAHHRETNHLLAVLWDFIDGLPTYVAAFYQEGLEVEDWGRLVKPKDGGGRTTSVSVMKSSGVKKMCNNWVAVINDERYINLLSCKKWIGYRVDNCVVPKKKK